MQRKLIALAIAGLAAAPVFAQSNVQIYGVMDLAYSSYTHDHTGTTQDDYTGSRLGFQGEEDLGSGAKAIFSLEERFKPDTGAANTGAANRWADHSWVGVKGGFGQAIFGRVSDVLDAWGDDSGGFDTANGHFLGDKTGDTSRVNNAVQYTSPALGPVTLMGVYGLSERVSTTADAITAPVHALTHTSVGAKANFGPAEVVAAYEKNQNQMKVWMLAGAYDLGVVKLNAVYTSAKQFVVSGVGFNGNKVNNLHLGAVIPVATGNIGLTYRHQTGKATDGTDSEKFKAINAFGVAYQHDLSKRTSLLAGLTYAHQKKDGITYDSGFTGAASGFGNSDSAAGVTVGLRHSF